MSLITDVTGPSELSCYGSVRPVAGHAVKSTHMDFVVYKVPGDRLSISFVEWCLL